MGRGLLSGTGGSRTYLVPRWVRSVDTLAVPHVCPLPLQEVGTSLGYLVGDPVD